MTSDGYHHTNLKQKLIDAGLQLILKEGVDALSLRRLAAECGVSHAAPYKHFKNKEDILDAILYQAERSFVEEQIAAIDAIPDASPKERLVNLGVAYVQFMVENPDYFRLLFLSDAISLHPCMDLAAPPSEDTSLSVFYRTAVAYLASCGADERNRSCNILAMWAMVHGLAAMLVNHTLNPGEHEDYRDIVSQILHNNLVFP